MKRISLIILCALLTVVSAKAQEIESYDKLKTNSWSIYGGGGISWAQGEGLIDNIYPDSYVFICPMFNGGVSYYARPWFRMNLSYEQSKYRRQQRFDVMQSDGLTYRNLESLYHDVEFSYDVNLSELFKREKKRWNVYIGSGIGGMLTRGVDYTIRIDDPTTNPELVDEYSFSSNIIAENEVIAPKTLYFPVNMSIEFDIHPRFTIGVRGGIKMMLDRQYYLPNFTESVGLVLRLNLFGERNGYTSRRKQLNNLNNRISSQEDAINQLNEDLAVKKQKAKNLQDEISQLEKDLEECQNAAVQQPAERPVVKFVVFFAHDSYDLNQLALATIDEAANYLNDDPEATAIITASCSTVGTDEYNMALSERRAEAVRDALIGAGIAPATITDVKAIGSKGMDNTDTSRRAIIDIK